MDTTLEEPFDYNVLSVREVDPHDRIPWSLIYFSFWGWWALLGIFAFHIFLFH